MHTSPITSLTKIGVLARSTLWCPPTVGAAHSAVARGASSKRQSKTMSSRNLPSRATRFALERPPTIPLFPTHLRARIALVFTLKSSSIRHAPNAALSAVQGSIRITSFTPECRCLLHACASEAVSLSFAPSLSDRA
ncbi:hypothetical protein TRVL_08921 [Trypanosoma vivax]|nr:hypothetical protein TRVL_08921 [Trypanosoma vivax]